MTLKNIDLMDLIVKPIITEKATRTSEYGQVTFNVSIDTTKKEVRQAIEKLFKVKVKKVNTIRVKGKRKKFQGIKGKRKDVKKAIVTLHEGDSIDVSTGL